MKRIVLALLGTVAGVVSLLSFKTTAPIASGALPSAGLPAAGTSTSTSTSTSTTPVTSHRATSTRSSKATSSKTTSPKTQTTSPASATTPKSYTGSAVTTRYGVVQVEVTVRGTKIVNVRFVQLTAFDPHSQDINSQAGPILLQETLSAQSSQIDTVSGATYTSDGYLQSLQSALDSAGIR